jgi:hypothetical protein
MTKNDRLTTTAGIAALIEDFVLALMKVSLSVAKE